MSKSKPCRALIAYGAAGTAVVIATDNADLAELISNSSDRGEEIKITADGNEKPGLYLFEGFAGWETYVDFEGHKDAELEFDGVERPVLAHELSVLLAMTPPDEELLAWGEDYHEELP